MVVRGHHVDRTGHGHHRLRGLQVDNAGLGYLPRLGFGRYLPVPRRYRLCDQCESYLKQDVLD